MDIETRRKISRAMKGKSNFEGKKHTHATKIQIGISQEGHRNAANHKWVTDKETGQEHRVKGDKPKGSRWGRTRAFSQWVHNKENFEDGRNPQDKGDMARHGLKNKTMVQLKKIRGSDSASPREKQLAHWYINMHREETIIEAKATMCGRCGTKHVRPQDGGTCPALSKERNAALREQEVWDKPSPAKTPNTLSPSAKARAKARAKAAGRPYPNMVDNIWAAKNEDTSADRLLGTTSLADTYAKDTPGQEKKKIKKVEEATKSRRMSAALKLQRAWDRERSKSDASRDRMRRELELIRDKMKPQQPQPTHENTLISRVRSLLNK
jgi:hypothetical protein